MNLRQFSFITLLLTTTTTLHTGNALIQKIAQETDAQKQIALFFTVFPDPATVYPSLTQVDDAVTHIFGDVLGLPTLLLDPLHRFYAYLKQQALNTHLATVIVQDGKKKISLLDALSNAHEKLELAQYHKDTEVIPALTKQIATLKQQAHTEISKLGPQILTLCSQTKEWQNHLKIFLTNSFSYEYELLGNINQDEIKMFTYIPQFETSYYSSMYATLRNDAEYVRIFLVMTDILRQRVKPHCTDWAKLSDLELYDAIETFKKTPFYAFAKQFETVSSQTITTPLKLFSLEKSSIPQGYADYLTCTQEKSPTVTTVPGMESLFSIKNNMPSLTSLGSYLLKEQMITPKKGASYPGLVRTSHFDLLFTDNPNGSGRIPSELFMELLSFNAINLLNQNNSYLFNQANLADTMKRLNQLHTKGTSDLASFPNVIFYRAEDELFLEDINMLTEKVITTPSAGAAQPACSSFLSAFVSLGHALERGWDWTIRAIKTVNHVVKQAANEFADIAENVWNATAQAAEVVWHATKAVSTDLGDLTVDVATGNWSGAAAQTGDLLSDSGLIALGNDIAKAGFILVNGIALVAKKIITIEASVLGKIVATITQDPQLGDDLADTIDSVADIVIDGIRDCTDMLIQYSVDVVVLSAEAIILVTQIIISTVASFATGNFNNMDAIASESNQFLQDTVSAVLGMVTLCGKLISDALKNVMVSIAYLTAELTDVIDVVAENLAAFGVLIAEGPAAAARERDSVAATMAKHRRLISAIVGTVLMVVLTVVVTIATGGALTGPCLAMLALTAAMMVPAIIGANQQDMDASAELESQEAFLASFTTYVQECGPAQQALQNNLLAETGLRLEEQAHNADRGLVYYQNYVNSTLNTTHAVQAYQTSSFYNVLTTPDTIHYPPTGMLPADTGYSYGIQTSRLDLNPSQGFRVYNAERGTFAQEIATLPAPLETQEQTTNSIPITASSSSLVQHFITQKDICNFTTNQKTVTVRWRVIYESQGDFYIGIYLNKNYLDTGFLNFLHSNFEGIAQNASGYDEITFNKAWQPLKTFNNYLYNFDYLAQAFVCYSNKATQYIPALGIYQHLGKGFLSSNNQPSKNPWFARGTWYIMTATATDTNITVAFSQENNPSITWKGSAPLQALRNEDSIPYKDLMSKVSYSPQQEFTGSFGIITSGAAVEYEILTPQQMVTPTTQRQTSNTTVAQTIQSLGSPLPEPVSELQRERQWIQALEKNIHPSFANWKLTGFSDLTIAQGTYVYATPSTNLSKKIALTDFVVSLANPPGTSAAGTGIDLLQSSAHLGRAITPSTQYMISLVTGNCYNAQGSFVLNYPDALTTYLQQNPKLPTSLSASINAAIQAYYTSEVGGFVFQNLTVTGVLKALKKDIFIYSCPSFTQYLSDLDYLIFVNTPNNGDPGTTEPLSPLSQNNGINSAISLVTGTVFTLVAGAAQTPINQLPSTPWKNISLIPSGVTLPQILSTYQPLLDTKTVTLINTQASRYQKAKIAAQQAAIQAQLAPPPPITPPLPPVQPAPVPSLASLESLFGSSTGGGEISFSG